MYHSFFIHSSVEGHLGCFHVLAIVNKAAKNIGLHMSFSILVSSGYVHSSWIVGSYGGFMPSFLKESPYCSPQWLYQFAFPPTVAQLVKNLLQCGRPGFDPRLGRSPGEGKGYPLQYNGLENSRDCIVQGGHTQRVEHH